MPTSKPKPPLERDIVLAILQWLQAKYPDWCWVRVEPASALRARAYRGRGYAKKMPEDAWSDGVADVLGVYGRETDMVLTRGLARRIWVTDRPVAFEVKSKAGKQRESQIAFQARWEKAGGRYHVVRSVEDVERIMEAL